MPLPAPNEVRIWALRTDGLDDRAVDAALALLSPTERARYDQLGTPNGRREYALSHALVRTSLSRCAPVAPSAWVFYERDGGKPALAPDPAARATAGSRGPRAGSGDTATRSEPGAALAGGSAVLSFNLSHTNGLIACAIGPDAADVGVDVERVDRKIDELAVAARFFSAPERDHIDRLAADQRRPRFFELWTLKEAYLKAVGIGLSYPLSDVRFELDRPEGITFVPPSNVARAGWQFALFEPSAGYRLALAARRVGRTPWQVNATLMAGDTETALNAIRTSVA